jgi:hypothetical protein
MVDISLEPFFWHFTIQYLGSMISGGGDVHAFVQDSQGNSKYAYL